jgi:glutathione S-transferase
MLEHTGTAYNNVSDRGKFADVMSKFGASGDCFAPPVVQDGDFVVSQSTACSMYLGKKLGLTPAGYNDYKCMQWLADCVDVFEGGVGKSNEHGPTLKKFLEGGRWAQLMSNLEAGIQGPFYLGAEPCAADFFLASMIGHRATTLFAPVKEKYGFDAMAGYPKAQGVYDALSSTDAWKNYSALNPIFGPVKDEVLNAYNAEE